MNEDLRIKCLRMLEEIEDLISKKKSLKEAHNFLLHREDKAYIKFENVKFEIQTSSDKSIISQKRKFLKTRYKNNPEELKSDINRNADLFFYWECDHKKVFSEKLRMKLFDAEVSFKKAEEKCDHKSSQMQDIDRKIDVLREEIKKIQTYQNLMHQCTHPICYNTGFFKGNNPARRFPQAEANYSVDICLECGSQCGCYRESNQKKDPNWYKPNYVCIEHKDGTALKEVAKYYRDVYMHFPENESVALTRKFFSN